MLAIIISQSSLNILRKLLIQNSFVFFSYNYVSFNLSIVKK